MQIPALQRAAAVRAPPPLQRTACSTRRQPSSRRTWLHSSILGSRQPPMHTASATNTRGMSTTLSMARRLPTPTHAPCAHSAPEAATAAGWARSPGTQPEAHATAGLACSCSDVRAPPAGQQHGRAARAQNHRTAQHKKILARKHRKNTQRRAPDLPAVADMRACRDARDHGTNSRTLLMRSA
jgi:hypothetical protein